MRCPRSASASESLVQCNAIAAAAHERIAARANAVVLTNSRSCHPLLERTAAVLARIVANARHFSERPPLLALTADIRAVNRAGQVQEEEGKTDSPCFLIVAANLHSRLWPAQVQHRGTLRVHVVPNAQRALRPGPACHLGCRRERVAFAEVEGLVFRF
jgi:hypothetical protein